MNGGNERVKVLGLSMGGSFKAIYREASTLVNIRVKYIPHRFLKHPYAPSAATTKSEAIDRCSLTIARARN